MVVRIAAGRGRRVTDAGVRTRARGELRGRQLLHGRRLHRGRPQINTRVLVGGGRRRATDGGARGDHRAAGDSPDPWAAGDHHRAGHVRDFDRRRRGRPAGVGNGHEKPERADRRQRHGLRAGRQRLHVRRRRSRDGAVRRRVAAAAQDLAGDSAAGSEPEPQHGAADRDRHRDLDDRPVRRLRGHRRRRRSTPAWIRTFCSMPSWRW
jgi:hypothetical protein